MFILNLLFFMNPHMSFQMMLLCECFFTKITFNWLLSCMNYNVSCHISLCRKCLVANITCEMFFFLNSTTINKRRSISLNRNRTFIKSFRFYCLKIFNSLTTRNKTGRSRRWNCILGGFHILEMFTRFVVA